MDARKLKEGELKRFKSGLLSNKWKDCHVALFSDSTLAIYDKKDDSRPIEQFFLKDIAPYICVGLMTDRMPTKRPDLPTGASVHHLVGFGQDPKAEKVTWLLFGSDSDLESWFNSITQTLPKPQNPPSAPAQQPGTNPNQPLPNQPLPTSNQGGYVPPAQYPSGPKNYYPQNPNNGPPQQVYNNGPPSNNQQPYYQGQPQSTHTTVIVDRDRSYGGGYSSGSSGLGFGSGALLGGLMGYGIGSFFTPSHYYGGGFGGFGLGHGFGGGYPMGGMGGSYPIGGGSYSTQDNDTYNVTNNYYNNDNDHNSQPQDNYNNDSQSQDNYNNSQDNNYQDQDNYQDDYQDQDDGDDQGGDFDAGGGDFDGGDW